MGLISPIYSSDAILRDAERHRADQKRRAEKENKRKLKLDLNREKIGKKPKKKHKVRILDEKDQYGRPMYRPGMGRAFYRTSAWVQTRYRVMQKRGAKCECCGATKHDDVKLHVDHIRPRSKFPLLELVEDNLQVLCEDCNQGKGAWDQTDWRDSGGITHPDSQGIKAAHG